MQEAFEKIIQILKEQKSGLTEWSEDKAFEIGIEKAIEIVNQVAEEYVTDTNVGNNGWVPCAWTDPTVETEVFILARRKYKDGHFDYITTTAIYEDGTVLENDSYWNWEDIDGEWDEENECYIIPEGWWELRHYNRDEVYNNAVDDEVIAWRPLPDPYQPKGELEA